jgi:uncharacterized delta-60 repeat protein
VSQARENGFHSLHEAYAAGSGTAEWLMTTRTIGLATTRRWRRLFSNSTGDDDHPIAAPEMHTVGGTVPGLSGRGLVLKNVLSGSTTSASNGTFTLPDALADGSPYDVRVYVQPSNPAQACAVAHGSGTISGADVTNVQVTCASLAPSGSLDPSLGTNGRVVSSIPFSTDVFDPRMGMALQTDGRILLVGGLTLARFNADGSPDMSFGSSGKVTTDFAGSTDLARRVRIQSDSKLLVTGYAAVPVCPSVYTREFALARYNVDGSLDTSFSLGGGKVSDSAGRNFNGARGIAIQADGKIILAGVTADNGASANDVGLIRYWGDTHPGSVFTGERDATFGLLSNGTVDSNLKLADDSRRAPRVPALCRHPALSEIVALVLS